jgi:CubicO group peptidase (beta-lactamase class C family)
MWQRVRRGVIVSAMCATPAFSQVVPTPAAARCFANDFRTDVRGAIAGYATIAGIPGVSVGVVVRDALVFADGVGFANTRLRTSATADTPYNVASVTKLFTATLALQLAAEGRLELDAPVARYLPDTVHVPTDSSGTAITARHLLTHTAGLPKNPPNRRNQPVTGPIDAGVWDAYEVADLYRATARASRQRDGLLQLWLCAARARRRTRGRPTLRAALALPPAHAPRHDVLRHHADRRAVVAAGGVLLGSG